MQRVCLYTSPSILLSFIVVNSLLHFDVIGHNFLCRHGSKSGASMKCASCQGSGVKVSIRQIGPGMIQQMQHVCAECKGSGTSSLQ